MKMPLSAPTAVAILGGLLALLLLLLLYFGASAIAVVAVVVPVATTAFILLHHRRFRLWRELSQRRAVLLLQLTATLTFARALGGLAFSALSATGYAKAPTAHGEVEVIFEYLAGSRSTVVWDVVLLAVGFGFMWGSVAIARFKSPSATDTDQARNTKQVREVVFELTPVSQRELERHRKHKGYDWHLPQYTENWVGRDEELALAREMKQGVLAITGIGGQGKSSLAGKVWEEWNTEHRKSFCDWRDLREEGRRFRTQIEATLERVTAGEMTGAELKGLQTEQLVELFFRKTRGTRGLLVIDNADHYTNTEEDRFTRGVDRFVREALRTRSEWLVIVTCRPRISYADTRFHAIRLKGLSLDETRALFQKKGARRIDDEAIERLHRHTKGHPFWLNAAAAQVARYPDKAEELVQELLHGEEHVTTMLRSIWKSLNERQRFILHVMVESPRAESRERLGLYAEEAMTQNQFSRAFRSLDAVGLLISKRTGASDVQYEAHPVVRQFVYSEYPTRRERAQFMHAIAKHMGDYVLRIREGQKRWLSMSIQTFEYAADQAELLVRAGDLSEATKVLSELHDAFIARGLADELFRIVGDAFSRMDWDDPAIRDDEYLGHLVRSVVRSYAENRREEDARALASRYDPLVERGTADFIWWCTTLASMEWTLGNYSEAVERGREGVRVKAESGMDTKAEPEHPLHLALRDSGRVDEALEYFRRSYSVDEIVASDYTSGEIDAATYGNVGRCLQLKGDRERALVCYARSAELLKEETGKTEVLNQGWAALWIGEILVERGEYNDGTSFLQRCRHIWSRRAPSLLDRLAGAVEKLPEALRGRVTESDIDTLGECQRLWRAWL